MSETFWTQVPKVLKAHETSSVIDQEEWQPALQPERWTGRTKVVFIGGPSDGLGGLTHGGPAYLMVDLDGVSYAEYERTRTVYMNGPDDVRSEEADEMLPYTLSHLEYTYRRTVTK